MSELSKYLADYLAMRAALGYAADKRLTGMLEAFIDTLPALREPDAPLFTQVQAQRWALSPQGCSVAWWANRLSAVRQFALYLAGQGFPVGVPSMKSTPKGSRRAVPHLYSDGDISALMSSCDRLFTPVRASTMKTLTGLMAVTGMRTGEVIGLDVQDADLTLGTLRIRNAKGGKERIVALRPSTCAAITSYRAMVEDRGLGGTTDALLVSTTGTRLLKCPVNSAFRRMVQASGLSARPGSHPRPHDLRHTFAIRTMLDSYATHPAGDPARTLTLLATWLGHADPANTYWYLEASPELLAQASRNLIGPLMPDCGS
jgi:integrase